MKILSSHTRTTIICTYVRMYVCMHTYVYIRMYAYLCIMCADWHAFELPLNSGYL